MKKCPKFSKGGEPTNNPKEKSKELTPREWNDKNLALGYKRVNTKAPGVYGTYYDPNKSYQEVDEKTMTVKDLPYINYTHNYPQKPVVDPAHKSLQIGSGLTYNPNTGQYFNPVTQMAVQPIIEQYKKGGKVKGYDDGTTPAGVTPQYINGPNNQAQAIQTSGGGNYQYAFNNANTGGGPTYVKKNKIKINPQQAQVAGAIAMPATQEVLNNKTGTTQDTTNTAIDTTLASTTPWYGLAKSGSNLGKSALSYDEYGQPKSGVDKATNEWLTPTHEHAIEGYKRDGVVGGLRDLTMTGATVRSIADIAGEGNETQGAWGQINKWSGNTSKNMVDTNAINSAYRDKYLAEKSEARGLMAENKLASDMNKNDLINRRNAGETRLIDDFENPNKNIKVPVLEQYKDPNAYDPNRKSPQMMGKEIRGRANNEPDGYKVERDLNSLGNKYFSKGGTIKGKGTGTSDSIKAKIKEGSFIVPAKNNKVAKVIRKEVLNDNPNKVADVKQKQGSDIKVSDNEHLFTPTEKNKIVNKLGEEVLEELAPEAKENMEYAKGTTKDGVGDNDFAKKERAKIEAERKEDAKRYGEARAAQKAEEKKRILNRDIQEMLRVQLESKKQADVEYAKSKVELEALKKSYDTYDKQSSSALNAPQTTAEKYVGGKSRPNSEDVRKEKENLLKMIEEKQKNLDQAQKKLEYASNEQNYINSDFFKAYGVNKTAGPNDNRIDYLGGKNKINQVTSPVAETPANIPAVKGSQLAGKPSVASEYNAPNVTFDPIDQANRNPGPEDVPTEQPVMGAKESPVSGYNVPTLTNTPTTTNPSYNAPNTTTNDPARRSSIDLGDVVGAAVSYGIPIAQAYMGYKSIKDAGSRPVDKLDPDFLNSIRKTGNLASQAEINAQYGLTGDEKSLYNMQNDMLTRQARGTARNLAGGNMATSFALERAALNDSYGRNLQTKVLDNNLRMQKQQISADRQNMVNDLTAQKQAYNRNLFLDNYGAWQQKQQSGANLLGAGIQNFIGADRYRQEKDAIEKRNQNPYNV